jgi:arginase
MKPRVIVEAPSILGLDGTGVDQLSRTLLEAELAERIGAVAQTRVETLPQDPTRHPEHGMLNADAIARFTPTLADAIGRVLDQGAFPIVLGGDCTIVLGNMLALRRRGRFGLLYLDAHADFYQPEANINGEGASSDLALATGRGPHVMTRFDAFDRVVADENVVVFGFRDADEQREYGSQPLPATMPAYDLQSLRRSGVQPLLDSALTYLTSRDLDGFWIHFDVDVLDDALMPAVKYRLPGGLSWEEIVLVLQRALGTGRAVGMEITIYDPTLDPDHRLAPQLVDAVSRGFEAYVAADRQ